MPSIFRTPALRRITAAMAASSLLLAAYPVAAAAAPEQAGTTYHVAQSGSDSAAGSDQAPFQSIQKCAAVAVAGDTCLIGAGDYHETVKPAHSGTPGAPITFASAPGQNVTINGTDDVTGWQLDEGNIYKASVKLSGSADAPYSSTEYPANDDLWANQIFSGFSMIPEAAYPAPSADPFHQNYVTSGWSSTRNGHGDCNRDDRPCTEIVSGTLSYPDFPAFGDLTGTVAQFVGGWVALTADVTGGTLEGNNTTLDISFPKSDDDVYPGGGNVSQFRLVGSKSFLTGPGQWYYDAGGQQLYMWADDGGEPTNIRAKQRNYSFDLDGASNIEVRNITTFANSVTTDDASNHITLDGLNSSFLSHWQTAQYSEKQPYAGIYDANHRYDSGLLLHGTNNTLRNSAIRYSSGNGVNLKGSGHTIENNMIHDVSYNGTYTAAVTIEVGTHDSKILNNSLFNTGRDAINMNTNDFPNPGYKNLEIGYNDITGYAKISYDLGGIYVCCDAPMTGTRIHHNTIHDPANTGNGMHFDNGAYDMTVDHNAIWGLKGVGNINLGGNGINIGGNQGNNPWSGIPYLKGTFVNNTIVSGRNYTLFNYFADAGYVANSIVKNNILDGDRPGGMDYGYIWGGTPQSATNLVTKLSTNGSGPNPLYVNPPTGHYMPQPGSPAVDAGTAIPGLTDGFSGAAPDIGAYETGIEPWVSGCGLAGCPSRVTTAPDTPTQATAIAGNESATVSWKAPASNGGAVITKYTATAIPGGQSCTTTGETTCTVSGLPNDEPVAFTVTASNANGTSAPTPVTKEVTPRVAVNPGPPENVLGFSADSAVTVTWEEPSDNGHSAITRYSVTASPGGSSCTTEGATHCAVTGLSNGTAYTFSVVATNAAGDSAPSELSPSVTPATAVPGNVALNKPVTAYYTASEPTRQPGNAVDGIYWNDSNGFYSDSAWDGSYSDGDDWSTSGSLCTWMYVDLGQNYALTEYQLQTGEGHLEEMWNAPYKVQVLDSATADAKTATQRNSSECTRRHGGNFGSIETGSTGPGTPFVVAPEDDIWTTVASGNGVGGSKIPQELDAPVSARYVRILSNEPNTAHQWGINIGEFEAYGTPINAPATPSAVTAVPGASSATVSWTASAAGTYGAASYTVTASPGGKSCSTATTSCSVTGLDNGTAYTFQVSATGQGGKSAPSAPSAAVTPAQPRVTSIAPPVISGTPAVGSTLSATPGIWDTEGATFQYQWLRDGVVIDFAWKPTYLVAVADDGRRLSVQVTATADPADPGVAVSHEVLVRKAGSVDLDIRTAVSPRELAGNNYLSITAVNHGTDPADITISTPYGSKTFSAVRPGKSATVAFNTRLALVPAGVVDVIAKTSTPVPASSSWAVPYAAFGQ